MNNAEYLKDLGFWITAFLPFTIFTIVIAKLTTFAMLNMTDNYITARAQLTRSVTNRNNVIVVIIMH